VAGIYGRKVIGVEEGVTGLKGFRVIFRNLKLGVWINVGRGGGKHVRGTNLQYNALKTETIILSWEGVVPQLGGSIPPTP